MLLPRPFRLQLEPPVGDLVIVDVNNISPAGCVVVVDSTLADPLIALGGADPTKWTMRLGSTLYEGKAIAAIAFNQIELSFNSLAFQPGPDLINYSNAPSDIETVAGRILPAVMGFPITP